MVNYLTCAPEDAPALVESLIAHPAVRRVNFTGSTPVGRIIARTCGQYLKPAVLKLGGKAPLLVLDDADIEQAAAGAVFGAFANAGQICMSTERIIVDNAVAEAFIPLLARRAAALPAALTGPVVDMNTIARCNALIDDALAKGARLLTGGKANDTHMSPTLLDGVTREMRLWREESFGPVKAIIRVHSEEEALAVANDSEYGLSAAVYSRDSARAWNVAQRLHTGICHINGPTVHDEAQMPFGGCKASGYGRFGGRAGIAEFTELRWITIQTQPRELPSEAQRLLTMAGDKLRQPLRVFPRHRVSGMGHDADRDPLCLNEVAIRVRERPLSDDQHFLARWHSWVNQGVSLPRIRLLAARQTAQGRCFVNNPPTASAPPPAAWHSRQRQRLSLTAPQCACCTRRRRRTGWVPRPTAWSPARPVAPPLRWRCSLPCYARTARSAAGAGG